MARPRLLPDNFTLALLGAVAIATLLPARGQGVVVFEWITNLAIGLLFFMHGAKLSGSAILAGMGHWRLHLLVFSCTFVLFPLLGLALRPLLTPMIGAELEGGSTLDAIGKIVVQLLLPFIAGQIARRWIGDWVARNKGWLKNVDQSSILLVVYTAFSHAVVEGIWQQVPLPQLLGLVLACCLLLALALLSTWLIARWLGFDLEDRITILFAGSKKSLATGIPMAQVLFAGGALGTLILPLMLFHQIQLMVCAVLAQRYASRPETATVAKAG